MALHRWCLICPSPDLNIITVMKYLHNIEKSAFRKGEYVGYCNGAQRIIKSGQQWVCNGLVSSAGTRMYASAATLEELSKILDGLES